ncbi:MAG: hypothetical protein JXB05_29325 [Myxococcaceae bacterium]|nr:hypothetical protein [Myxococcaceae bacterium]
MTVRARCSQLCIRGLGASLLIALGGCGPALPEEVEGGWETREEAIRIPNSLTTQALIFNALSTNRVANQMLGSTPLTTLFNPPGDPYIQNQLRDPNAQAFMPYLVSCALATGQNLAWRNPLTGTNEVWRGKMGLCTEWATQPPSQACLERVSSCLLARNNAFGKRVELSARGEHPSSPAAFGLELVTRPTEYDPSTSQRLDSFYSCATNTLGMQRNCGWEVDAIGSCDPGETVRLGAGGHAPDMCTGSALGSSSGRTVVRVCEDIAGCDDGGPRLLAQSEGSCSTTAPAVSFTCPAAGYFSVMTAPYESNLSATATVQVEAPASYRLSEAQVFRLREGAFYGTIFDPSALAVEIVVRDGKVIGRDQVVDGSVYRRMFSCYDSAWANSAANATHRVCALPASGSNCAATVAGACLNPAKPSYPSSKCMTDDGPQVVGDGDYQDCRDTTGQLWKEPVTVYLHGACDVVGGSGSSDLCARK